MSHFLFRFTVTVHAVMHTLLVFYKNKLSATFFFFFFYSAAKCIRILATRILYSIQCVYTVQDPLLIDGNEARRVHDYHIQT